MRIGEDYKFAAVFRVEMLWMRTSKALVGRFHAASSYHSAGKIVLVGCPFMVEEKGSDLVSAQIRRF